jgi:hypothetical protein
MPNWHSGTQNPPPMSSWKRSLARRPSRRRSGLRMNSPSASKSASVRLMVRIEHSAYLAMVACFGQARPVSPAQSANKIKTSLWTGLRAGCLNAQAVARWLISCTFLLTRYKIGHRLPLVPRLYPCGASRVLGLRPCHDSLSFPLRPSGSHHWADLLLWPILLARARQTKATLLKVPALPISSFALQSPIEACPCVFLCLQGILPPARLKRIGGLL